MQVGGEEIKMAQKVRERRDRETEIVRNGICGVQLVTGHSGRSWSSIVELVVVLKR